MKTAENGFRVKVPIFYKIMVYSMLLVFVSVGMSTYLAVKGESKVFREGLVQGGKNMARNLGASTKSAFWSLNWIFVETMLKESVQDGLHQVICAKIVKPTGEVYLASERACYGEQVDKSLLSGRETLVENHFFPERNEHGILLIHPVGINGEKWHVILGLSLMPVKEAIRDLVIRNLAWGSLIVLLGIAGAFFFSKSISNPLVRLANAARMISRGDWEHHVVIKSKDEVGLLSHSFDKMIRELKAATTELAASEQMYRSLITTGSRAGIGICVLQNKGSRKGLIRYANQMMSNLTGYSDEELLTKSIDDLMHPDSLNEAWENYTKKEGGEGSASTHRYWGIDKEGRKVPVELSSSVTQFQGKPALVCYIKDITEKVRAEEQLKQYSQDLERMVEKRTSELKKTLLDLQNTQSQLLQSEKMASIGQLAAGVAHEINNPVGFVKSNLGTINEYWKDLMRLLDQYCIIEAALIKQTNMGMDGTIQNALANIQNEKDTIDLDFILSDYKDVVSESLNGIQRVEKIVSDLKNFAHAGNDRLERADLNKGINSALNIVWNELKYKAQVTKDFGDIPLVKCYPQRLNQVFMNILVNAAQAIEDKGKIHIATRADNGHVAIRISDTGCGMPPEIIPKIFDPFFTTKEVGKGTGLGLNVAYNIIQAHKGTIDVESQVGKGTTFTIRLQIDPDLELDREQHYENTGSDSNEE